MNRKIIPILLLSFTLWVGCETSIEISEKNLLGIWEEVNSGNTKAIEQKGILISEMESGLYIEEIIIMKNKNEFEYSILSDGCFIELNQQRDNEIKLNYTCLGGEFEHPIKMTSKKLVIGKKIFKKYST